MEASLRLELLAHRQLGSGQRVRHGLLRDVQIRRDLALLQVALEVEMDYLALSFGQDVDVIEQCLRHGPAAVDPRQVLVIDSPGLRTR